MTNKISLRKNPSILEVIGFYRQIAEIERQQHGRPCKAREDNVISSVRSICKTMKISLKTPFSTLTWDLLLKYKDVSQKRGLANITIKSHLDNLHAITARWAMLYFKETGCDIMPIEVPFFRRQLQRYLRPSRELLSKISEWYNGLYKRDRDLYLIATMMLEFGMRNGDVRRLRWENFVQMEDSVYLRYTPNKTSLSSGRIVCWPVHKDIWDRLLQIRQATGAKNPIASTNAFLQLNRELRKLGLNGTKASYELRKICIDHIYQKFGAEMAVSISGDDIRTVSRYYADPSKTTVQNVRIVDLL